MTAVMGIVNVTPDSFSDGGMYASPEEAVRRARNVVSEGAAFVDFGAESTRPGATPIGWEEEWARLEPVLSGFGGHLNKKRVSVHSLVVIDSHDVAIMLSNNLSSHQKRPSLIGHTGYVSPFFHNAKIANRNGKGNLIYKTGGLIK